MSHGTMYYPCFCFKPEIVSLAHKDPYAWNKTFSENFKSLNFIQILLKLES